MVGGLVRNDNRDVFSAIGKDSGRPALVPTSYFSIS